MSQQILISDAHLIPLAWENGRLVLLRDDHHLLRRFGQAEVRRLASGEQTPFVLRAEADEVWAAIEGQVQFRLIDRRPGSPSEDQRASISLDAARPQALLIPFGVAYAILSIEPSALIRLATHADGAHGGDETLPAERYRQLFERP